MPPTLAFHNRGPMTYKSATNKEANIIHQLAYLPAATRLRQETWELRDQVETLTRCHLGLGSGYVCSMLDQSTWIQGSFNICVPIEVKLGNNSCTKVIFRCPMPHKLAEGVYASTVDEKLRCEVGAYTWMQERCGDVRIPHLYGFGFSDGRHVRKLFSCCQQMPKLICSSNA